MCLPGGARIPSGARAGRGVHRPGGAGGACPPPNISSPPNSRKRRVQRALTARDATMQSTPLRSTRLHPTSTRATPSNMYTPASNQHTLLISNGHNPVSDVNPPVSEVRDATTEPPPLAFTHPHLTQARPPYQSPHHSRLSRVAGAGWSARLGSPGRRGGGDRAQEASTARRGPNWNPDPPPVFLARRVHRLGPNPNPSPPLRCSLRRADKLQAVGIETARQLACVSDLEVCINTVGHEYLVGQ